MLNRKIFGIILIIALAAGISITTTRCYDDNDDKEARVTIHLERNDLAALGIKPQPEKHFIDRVLEFFSTRAEASFWNSSHANSLVLKVTSPSFADITFSIPANTTSYSVIIPSGNNITFTITHYNSSLSYKTWGGEQSLNIGPGDQNISITMFPMTNLNVSLSANVSLGWDSANDGSFTKSLSYNLYRSTDVNGTYIYLKTVTDSGLEYTNTTDTAPTSGIYYYKISVNTTFGEGIKSDPATWPI